MQKITGANFSTNFFTFKSSFPLIQEGKGKNAKKQIKIEARVFTMLSNSGQMKLKAIKAIDNHQ